MRLLSTNLLTKYKAMCTTDPTPVIWWTIIHHEVIDWSLMIKTVITTSLQFTIGIGPTYA